MFEDGLLCGFSSSVQCLKSFREVEASNDLNASYLLSLVEIWIIWTRGIVRRLPL
jgi:hypothetical protein